jgi:tetratricopeptide (TPR) repeat protein
MSTNHEKSIPVPEHLIARGDNYLRANRSPDAIQAYQEAIRILERTSNLELQAVAEDHLGLALTDSGDFDRALVQFDLALTHESRPLGLCAIRHNRALVWAKLGELRMAAREHDFNVQMLEKFCITGRELAIALDQQADCFVQFKQPELALALLQRARHLFTLEDVHNRALNAIFTADAHLAIGDRVQAASAFREAYALASADAERSIVIDEYRAGFARARQMGRSGKAVRSFRLGMQAMGSGDYQAALQHLSVADQQASASGDNLLMLTSRANLAALLANRGQVQHAIDRCMSTIGIARQLRLARPEKMATGTLGSLGQGGAEIGNFGPPLLCYVRALSLLSCHKKVIEELDLSAEDNAYETQDEGMLDLQLAKTAADYGADDLAISYYQSSIRKAEEYDSADRIANRRAGLLELYFRTGQAANADVQAAWLVAWLPALNERQRVNTHHLLAHHYANADVARAINHLRAAHDIAEIRRARVEAGEARSEVSRDRPWINQELATLLRRSGDVAGAFEVLQHAKGRRLIDLLAAKEAGSGTVSGDRPPNLGAVRKMLRSCAESPPTFLVDFCVEAENGLSAYVVGETVLEVIHVPGDLRELFQLEKGDAQERRLRIVDFCLRSDLLREVVTAACKVIPPGSRLFIVPDRSLHNLPLHIIPVDDQPWCEHFAMGYLPSIGVLRFLATRNLHLQRALVIGDSLGDLPHARAECVLVAKQLCTMPLLGSQCTLDAIRAALSERRLDMIHFATHGRGDAHRGGRSSLLLTDGATKQWIDFDALSRLGCRAKLVVFSGCSTALAGSRHGGHEFLSVATTALEAGSSAVVACLWPVEDQAARLFMTAFYSRLQELASDGLIDLRVVCDQARMALQTHLHSEAPSVDARRRDARDFLPSEDEEHGIGDVRVLNALGWAPFVLIGNPIFRTQAASGLHKTKNGVVGPG